MTASTDTENRNEEALASGAASENPSLLVLAGDAFTVAKSLVELAALELGLALQSLPKIMGLFVVIFFLSLFAWLSFSTAVGWLAYVFLGSAGWGIAGFLLLQIIALLVCRALITTYTRYMSLPNTRDFVKTMRENFRDAAR
jgi:hypothetical protein